MSFQVFAAALSFFICCLPARAATPPLSARRVPRTDLSHSCSRSLSRVVRQRFSTIVRKKRRGEASEAAAWPDACPLNPAVDLFAVHEKSKTRKKSGEWECSLSGKVFKSEHYIDLHLERNYAKEVPANGVCLAEYCQVFGFCNITEPSFLETFESEPPPCDNAEMERYQRMCQDIVDRCVSDESANEQIHKGWCEQLTCEARATRHFHNRKWCIIISAIAVVFVLGICFLCMCVSAQEEEKPDFRGRKLGTRPPGGRPLPKTKAEKLQEAKAKSARECPTDPDNPDIVDMVPTKLTKRAPYSQTPE